MRGWLKHLKHMIRRHNALAGIRGVRCYLVSSPVGAAGSWREDFGANKLPAQKLRIREIAAEQSTTCHRR